MSRSVFSRSNASDGVEVFDRLRQVDAIERPFIQVSGLCKHYPTPSGDFVALKSIDVDFDQGKFNIIVGKSGAGKSTFVNMLTGVDHITSGEIWVDHIPVHRLDENQMALWRGLNVGVVYQSFQLMPALSLKDNIVLAMDFCGLFHPVDSGERAMELLRMVELQDHAYKLPSEISGGQQQRAAIARALANDPKLIVADEPTGNLDSVTAETVFEFFEKLVEQGKTLIMVSHDASLAQRAQRILVIEDGQITDEYTRK
jgi:ABC-type lipoprotein export system ATPase subunit